MKSKKDIKIQAKKDFEIHAKKTFEIQRMLKSKEVPTYT